MQITVQAKQAGKKRALIENQSLEINDIGANPTLEALLKAVVQQQVEEYNGKPAEKNLLPFLSKDEIDSQSVKGKVGFGSIYNENKADIVQAQANALQAFEDGLFSVFVNDDELRNLNDVVHLSQTSVFTFIRLTFLAGSYW
jgi:hypothetical protein